MLFYTVKNNDSGKTATIMVFGEFLNRDSLGDKTWTAVTNWAGLPPSGNIIGQKGLYRLKGGLMATQALSRSHGLHIFVHVG